MFMIKKNITLIFLFLSFMFIGLSSCNNDDNPESPYVEGKKKSTVLLYAVASNNLAGNLVSDKNEILSCASKLDLVNNSFLLYEVDNSYEPCLMELIQTQDGSYIFNKVKDYSEDKSSVSQSRIREVINDVITYSPSDSYGLILWSHGTGIDYYPEPEDEDLYGVGGSSSGPVTYSFGYDRNPSGEVYQINIDKLAEAIPSGVFNFIWFDACYMSGIETIYELRDKCDYYVAYPTEVFEWGMPYDLVMPYIVKPKADLIGGAKAFFNYYDQHPNTAARVATIAVVDMSKIEHVADLAAYANSIDGKIDVRTLQKYSRGSIGPFYDFNGYILQKSSGSEDREFEKLWSEALDDFVIYKASTSVDFNYIPIDLEQFSGISCHNYNPELHTDYENFYRSLAWFKRIN